MPEPRVNEACVFEDSGLTLMARVLGNDGNAIKQADFPSDGISYAVYEQDGVEVVPATTLVPSSVVFDTLQENDLMWRLCPGYNFAFTLPAASFAEGGKVLCVVISFLPAIGEKFHVVWNVNVINLIRS